MATRRRGAFQHPPRAQRRVLGWPGMFRWKKTLHEAPLSVPIAVGQPVQPAPQATAKLSSPPTGRVLFDGSHVSRVHPACQVSTGLLVRAISDALGSHSRLFGPRAVSGKAANVISPAERRSSQSAGSRFRWSKNSARKRIYCLRLDRFRRQN